VYRSLRLISAHRPILLRFPISRYSMIIPGDPDAVFAVLQQLPVHLLRRRPPAFGHPATRHRQQCHTDFTGSFGITNLWSRGVND
jgi:hypothetical protein